MKPLILVAALAASSYPSIAHAGDVVVTLEDVREAQGDLYIALQTREQFMKPAGSYGEIIKLPKAGKHVVTFKDVKPDSYSVHIWHDVNNDRQFNTEGSGIPLDGWAMINGEKLRALPRFEENSMQVPVDGAAVSLRVLYKK
jgi:uncharacterized protein (DUF2141 family)